MTNDIKWIRKTSVRNLNGWNRYILTSKKDVWMGYIDKSPGYKDYYAFVDVNPYNKIARLLGRFKYLNDAKKAVEEYCDVKRPAKKTKKEYGIAGELKPFGL